MRSRVQFPARALSFFCPFSSLLQESGTLFPSTAGAPLFFVGRAEVSDCWWLASQIATACGASLKVGGGAKKGTCSQLEEMGRRAEEGVKLPSLLREVNPELLSYDGFPSLRPPFVNSDKCATRKP